MEYIIIRALSESVPKVRSTQLPYKTYVSSTCFETDKNMTESTTGIFFVVLGNE